MKCPNCNRNWRWDWCQDTHRDDRGKECITVDRIFATGEDTDHANGDGEEKDWVTTAMLCRCSTILALTVDDERGSFIYNHESWEGVDWESGDNVYDPSETKLRSY